MEKSDDQKLDVVESMVLPVDGINNDNSDLNESFMDSTDTDKSAINIHRKINQNNKNLNSNNNSNKKNSDPNMVIDNSNENQLSALQQQPQQQQNTNGCVHYKRQAKFVVSKKLNKMLEFDIIFNALSCIQIMK